MRGGFRENAGRKKGFSAVGAEKAREFIIQHVNASLEPIIASLIKQAKKGEIRSIQLLFDRAYGRPITPFEATFENPKIMIADILASVEKEVEKANEKYAPVQADNSPANIEKTIERY